MDNQRVVHHSAPRLFLHRWGHRPNASLRTPAIAAGLTDHTWRLEELLAYQPPSPGKPYSPSRVRYTLANFTGQVYSTQSV